MRSDGQQRHRVLERRFEVLLNLVMFLIAIELVVIPLLWVWRDMNDGFFWTTICILGATIGIGFLLVRILKRVKAE
jgi:hypothetical protein